MVVLGGNCIMYQIKTLNKISEEGLKLFGTEHYSVGEDVTGEDAILVRSASLLEYAFPENLLAISRAGVGVNNIPVERCSEAGIAVFNTPGANANGVVELAMCGMLLGSRDVVGGINWASSQADNENVAKDTEKEKKKFLHREADSKSIVQQR